MSIYNRWIEYWIILVNNNALIVCKSVIVIILRYLLIDEDYNVYNFILLNQYITPMITLNNIL